MENLPDPQRTHFLWGFSKDFGLASFRFGVLHTFNKDLMKIMEGMCLYSSVEGHIQQMGGRMLQDKKWLDETYFPMNLKRVRSATPVGINRKGFVTSNFGMFLLLDYCIENERGSVGTQS